VRADVDVLHVEALEKRQADVDAGLLDRGEGDGQVLEQRAPLGRRPYPQRGIREKPIVSWAKSQI